jgi:uncharacterized protein
VSGPMNGPKPEPSMEEIMASIRDILDEEEPGQPTPLALTESMLVQPPQPEVAPAAPRPDVVALPPEPAPGPARPPAEALQAMVAQAATAAVLGGTAHSVAKEQAAPIARQGGPSIEDVVREELRPLLQAWLDRHMPGMVEDIVKAEIARRGGPGRP